MMAARGRKSHPIDTGAKERPGRRHHWATQTRRWFLMTTGAAILRPWPVLAVQGEPFDDGTWFADDGTGWAD